MKRLLFVSIIAVAILVSCSSGVGEDVAKQQIREWWQTESIQEVLIASCKGSRRTMMCSARLVVSGDTLGSMDYEFQRGMGGWKLVRGPFHDKQKEFMLEAVGLLNIDFYRSQLELMEMFAGVLDIYGSYTKGKYPLTLNTKLRDIPGYDGEKGGESVLSMMSPLLEGELPFIEGMGDTNEWFDEYRGRVIYYPLQKEDGYALQFAIRAAMDTCFVRDIMQRWRAFQEGSH